MFLVHKFLNKMTLKTPKVKTEGGVMFLIAKLRFFRVHLEDKKWACLLAMCPMSFKTGEKMPGVRSVAMISVRTVYTHFLKKIAQGHRAPPFRN